MIKKSYEIQNNPENFLKYNLFLLYGENYGLKKDIKDTIKKILEIKIDSIEILLLYENDIIDNEDSFYNSIYGGSLFSTKKIIIINNGTDKIISQIKNVVDKYPENTYLIIFSDILEKKSKLRNFFESNSKTICIPCYPDNENDLRVIARNELKKNNINLSNESISALVDKSNNDRNNLKNEIEKINSFALNNKNIEINELKSIINFTGEYKSENFINECLCGNIYLYKKILTELYSNSIDQIYFLRILSYKIQRLLNIKKLEHEHKSLDSLLSVTKPPIFWKEKPMVKKQLTIWNLKDLKKIVTEINATELLCKKNPQSSKIIFFNFFTKICKKASNFS